MYPSSDRIFQFDRFTLDLNRGCITIGGREVDLPPKAFAILTHLSENAGRLVAKEELLRKIWPQRIVSDESLAQCIRILRRKLGDDTHRLIKTVSRRGYLLDAAPIIAGKLESPARSARLKIIFVGMFLGLGLGGVLHEIVFNQLLQWHHIKNAGFPAGTVENFRFNLLLDDAYHGMIYIIVGISLAIFWRNTHWAALRLHGIVIIGAILIGIGAFNLIEGIVVQQILGLHHFSETTPQDPFVYWDIGFLIWVVTMVLSGQLLCKASAAL